MAQTQAISRERIVCQQPGNIVSNMGEDKVMMNIGQSKYYNLGLVGGRIWELICEPVAIERVIACVQSEYEVEPAACEAQVLSFLEHLYKEGLIGFAEGEGYGVHR